MIIRNISNNTIYLEDIDEHLKYRDGETEEIKPDKLLRSRVLRGFILTDMIEIVKYDENERIENSIVYMKNKFQAEGKISPKEKQVKIDDDPIPDPPAIVKDDTKIQVKIHGLFYDASGYGKVNRNLAMILDRAGVKVEVSPKRGQNQLNEDELKPIVKMTHNRVDRKNHILIDSIVPSFAEMSSGKYRILYTTIESYTVPKQFIDCCGMYNEIWLTSEWSASVLRQYVKDRPIYSVATGVDFELYTEKGPRFDFRPNIKDFVFISVFGWNYRKGYDVLLKAYFDEFSADDNVSLLIMSRYQSGRSKFHRNKIRDDINTIMKEFPNKDMPHVVRYSNIVPENDMPKMYRAASCFVLPTRGEGGGLPALEAAMCGLPVIMTNCSGQQGYLRENNSHMIEIDHLQEILPGQMHVHYWDGQKFPSLRSENVHQQLRQSMRNVVENYEEAIDKNRQMKRFIMQNFTWNHTCNQAVERLRDIHKKMRI